MDVVLSVLVGLVLVLGVVVLVVLLDIAKSLRDLRFSIANVWQRPALPREMLRADLSQGVYDPLTARADVSSTARADLFDPTIGFAVWVFREGHWELSENHCAPGYEPGAPPLLPGAHENYRIRQEGVPTSFNSVP